MSALRTHRYVVDDADFDEFARRRTTLIAAIRAAHPGLASTRLARMADGSYHDTWQWDSRAAMGAAAADLPNFPQAGAAMSLTRDNTAVDGELIDFS